LKRLKGKISKLLVLYIVLFSSVVTLILTAIQLWIDYNQGVSNLHQRIKQIEQTNIASITQSVWTLDNPSIQIQLDGLVRINDIIYVKITNAEGKIIAYSGDASTKNIIKKDMQLEYFYRNKNTPLGALTVIATKENIYQQLIDTIIVIMISQAVKTFLVSIFILVLFYYLVTRHLQKISEHSDEIEFTKKPKELKLHRNKYNSIKNDELETVISSINNMSSNIHQTYVDLINKNAKFGAIFDSLSDAVVITDNNRQIIQVNRAFHELFGYSNEDLKGNTTQLIYANPNEFLAQGKKRYNETTENKFSVYEIEYRRKNNSTFPSETMGDAIRLPNGSLIGFIGIIRDITSRKQAEKETAQLQEQIQQSHKMEAIGQLTGGIAHDFNNILSSILGYAELSKDKLRTSNDEKLIKYINNINSAGKRARDLVTQLLTFSRSGSSNPQQINLQILIDDVISLISPTMPSSIELSKEIAPNIPLVLMDETQMHQILMNLCINARDAMQGHGKLTIKVSNVDCVDGICSSCKNQVHGQYVKISIEDTGTGIQQNILDKIFDPFTTTKGIGKGTGMGLSVVHGILHKHNSHIIVDTITDKGTCFHLLIPPIENTDIKQAIPQPVETKVLQGDGKNKRILVVDDEAPVAEFMQDFLQSQEYIITATTSSKQAIEIFRNADPKFDLVITDQTMPEMTGDELVKEILKLDPHIPVILCSGYSETIDKKTALELGCAQYLMKPISNTALLQAIKETLSTSTMQ
jgi:PAS domain S-box-containing protein